MLTILCVKCNFSFQIDESSLSNEIISINCPQCKEKIRLKKEPESQLITCPECKKELPKNATICSGCGYPIRKLSAEISDQSEIEYRNSEKLLNEGEIERAKKAIQAALNYFPNKAEYIELDKKIDIAYKNELDSKKKANDALTFLNQELFENAGRSINEALELFPKPEYQNLRDTINKKVEDNKRADLLYQEAKELFGKSEYQIALKSISEAVSLFPKSLIYIDLKDNISKAYEYHLFEIAQGLYNEKDYKSCRRVIAECIDLAPNNKTFKDFNDKAEKQRKRHFLKLAAISLIVAGVLLAIGFYVNNLTQDDKEKTLRAEGIANAKCWQWLNPTPIGKALYSVKFVNTNTGFAVGQDGTILKTTDAGGNWKIMTSGVLDTLRSVCFSDTNTGYVVGNSGIILKTTNGGINWNKQESGVSYDLTSISFINANTGYIAGKQGTLLRTNDGGIQWTKLQSGTQKDLSSLYILDANTGYAVGDGGTILKTTNGGASWAKQSSPTLEPLNSICFTTINNGYIVGSSIPRDGQDDNIVLMTKDGGENWVLQDLPNGTGSNDLSDIHFINANTGYIVGWGGAVDCWEQYVILKTTDGGSHWKHQLIQGLDVITSRLFCSVWFTDENTGYIVNSVGSILKTTNGTDWAFQNSQTELDLFSICFPDANTGYAVGGDSYNHIILKTTDRGQNWIRQQTPVVQYPYLEFVYFIDNNTGYAIGDGIILSTTDGGTNWSELKNLEESAHINSVFFPHKSMGYMVGNDGLVIKTEDAGKNWTRQLSGIKKALNSVYFTDLNTGFAVGDTGTILKSTNGGKIWLAQNSGSKKNLFSVFFTDANNGFAVGEFGTILKTINGGEKWREVNSNSKTNLSSVVFTDSNTGFITFAYNWGEKEATRGLLLKTTDGGITWKKLNTGTNTDLLSAYFLNANKGYIVGKRGAIIKTTNGGLLK